MLTQYEKTIDLLILIVAYVKCLIYTLQLILLH